LTGLPVLPPKQSVEVIMLYLGNQAPTKRRQVPVRLKGKIREVGDIFSSAPAEDWGGRP
jgi:hypothetical protein